MVAALTRPLRDALTYWAQGALASHYGARSMTRPRKRGTRRIVGYVVSLSGKRGGPYAAGLWRSPDIEDAERHHSSESERAEKVANWWKVNAIPPTPDARVLPVVRYELDREEERLRDAVVEAGMAFAERMATLRAHLGKRQ